MAEPSTRILLGPASLLGDLSDPAKTVIVTEPEIRRLHGATFPPCPLLEVPRGEAVKSLASLERLYEGFLDLGIDREWTVLAIGGGSVTDLAGFAASTWMRGLDFGFVPTTLLAMVDASLGGKNGIDFCGFKNMVGCFSQPRFLLCDTAFLASLSDLEFSSGMAEVVKHGILSGEAYFGFLERECLSRRSLDRPRLERLVAGSQELKSGIVRRDERDAGERRTLNLGHSVGHAVESVSGLPHGHAVAAGLACACRLAMERSGFGAEATGRVLRLLERWGLPASLDAAEEAAAALGTMAKAPGFRAIVARSLVADKKRSRGDILFVLPETLGAARVERIAVAELAEFIMEAP